MCLTIPSMAIYTLQQSWLPNFFYSNPKSAPVWFLLRLYVGYEWLMAGWEKVLNPKWFGAEAGAAMQGFVAGALKKTAEFCPPAPAACHPDVSAWYASFLQSAVLPYPLAWANAIAVGEVLVGLGLIFGCLTGIAAFFGLFMNLNFMLAGTVSINPILFTLSIFLILAWRVAGYWGFDRFINPRFFGVTFNRSP